MLDVGIGFLFGLLGYAARKLVFPLVPVVLGMENTVTILAKNFVVFAVSSIAFLAVGFGIMFGDGTPLFGTQGLWFLGGADGSPATGEAYKGVYSALNWTGVPLWAKFFFQLVFAGTAATIVSGAVAERVKFGAFYLFSFAMVGLIYPVVGHWIWGGGWLAKLGFWDFAGSTVVHSVGGWAALLGALMLGPRLGKYGKDGRVNPIPGHSIALGTLGVFVLWFGWFLLDPLELIEKLSVLVPSPRVHLPPRGARRLSPACETLSTRTSRRQGQA